MPLSRSLDHLGPLTRSSADAALVLQALAGFDAGNPTSQEHAVDRYNPAAWRGRSHLRFGIPKTHFQEDFGAQLGASIEQALRVFQLMSAGRASRSTSVTIEPSSAPKPTLITRTTSRRRRNCIIPTRYKSFALDVT